MPRAGSTLIEQILSCHSAIEGTMELPDIPALALGLGREAKQDGRRWIEALTETPHEQLADMGAAFLERTAIQRKRSEEHTSELQSLMRISYAVFCLKQKTHRTATPAKKKKPE